MAQSYRSWAYGWRGILACAWVADYLLAVVVPTVWLTDSFPTSLKPISPVRILKN